MFLSKLVIIAIIFAIGCLLGTNLALARYVLRSIDINAALRLDLQNAMKQIALTQSIARGEGEYRVNNQGAIYFAAKE